jgi:hypothetical protein
VARWQFWVFGRRISPEVPRLDYAGVQMVQACHLRSTGTFLLSAFALRRAKSEEQPVKRAAVHSAAATWGRALDKGQHEHITRPHTTPSFSQVNGYMTAVDVRRIYPRYCASRGGQCASRVLLGGLGGQLLTDWWEVGYITRMCPFRHCSRHMQQISGQY